ncbi:MAG: tRNA (adenosine(37)-N6)-threonylcarbamoyltransferase complex ATPase subunit type 1 TsaE, partial [Phycisphaeraceae bacterium]
QTVTLGEAIGRCCTAGDIVALQGELGAGKTQLVRGLAQGLGLNPRQVSSPTFVMVQEYEPVDAQSKSPILVHIDAYRIGSPDELESIGWAGNGEELRDGAVVAIEWAKLIRPALGDDLLWIEIEHAPDGRRITLSAEGNWQDKMQAIQQSLSEAELI